MDFDLSYILNHLGERREDYLNSVAPPIFQTAMFASPTVADMRTMIQNEQHQPFYSRGNNPTVNILREKMAALEGTEDALIFASGAAAIAAAVMANVQAGDHIISVQKPYSWTRKLLQVLLPRFGVQLTYIDGTDAQNFERAIQPNTKVLFLETPNSWTYEQQDLEAVGKIAKAHNLVSIVDNSYATPLYQQPARFGIDIMTHSATKYIGGHSDTVAGVLCASREMTNKIFAGEFMTLGGIISPFNAWLLLRGLRTLEVRLERVSQTTEKVIAFLEKHERIEKIWYPFHAQNPQFELAKKQMKAGAGMFTIAIKADDMPAVERVCNNLKRFLLAVSWGAYESLAFPACALYGSPNYPNPDLEWNRVRMCIGLESPDVLIEDLAQALATV